MAPLNLQYVTILYGVWTWQLGKNQYIPASGSYPPIEFSKLNFSPLGWPMPYALQMDLSKGSICTDHPSGIFLLSVNLPPLTLLKKNLPPLMLAG
jgi:hypothetical protein